MVVVKFLVLVSIFSKILTWIIGGQKDTFAPPTQLFGGACPGCPLSLRLWMMVSWAAARVGVHRLSFRLPYLGVFPFTIFTCHWISFVFFLYSRRICTHSVDPSLTHFLGKFHAWDWLWNPGYILMCS